MPEVTWREAADERPRLSPDLDLDNRSRPSIAQFVGQRRGRPDGGQEAWTVTPGFPASGTIVKGKLPALTADLLHGVVTVMFIGPLSSVDALTKTYLAPCSFPLESLYPLTHGVFSSGVGLWA